MSKHTEQKGGGTDWFIDQYGLLSEQDGISRTAGRIFALMLIDPGPLSFSELAERLQVSRASISTNTRLLENLGAIERIAKAGERQDYFRMVPNPWIGLLERHIASQSKRRELAQGLLREEPGLGAEQRERVERLIGYSDDIIASAKALIERFGK